jgi:CRP-like cAMP-binding protein
MAVDAARLNDIEFFSSLTEQQRVSVAAALEERTAHPGDHLTSEGGSGYFFFVIEAGTATVTRGDETLAQFGPGDFFGEAAIFSTIRRTATVTATSDMRLLVLFGADFAKLSEDIPPLHDQIAAALEARLPK